jgi:Fe-S cluster assembly scaffold protein SufB
VQRIVLRSVLLTRELRYSIYRVYSSTESKAVAVAIVSLLPVVSTSQSLAPPFLEFVEKEKMRLTPCSCYHFSSASLMAYFLVILGFSASICNGYVSFMVSPLRRGPLISSSATEKQATKKRPQLHLKPLQMVSVGLGPPPKEPGQLEDEDTEIQFMQSLSEMVVTEEGRTAEMSQFDRSCDAWFSCLLSDENEDSSRKFNLPRDIIEKMQKEIYYKVLPQDVYDEYIHDKTDPLWTPYTERHLRMDGVLENTTAKPFTPPPGLEQYGLPIVRRQSEAWRHFDVANMISTAYYTKKVDTNIFQDEVVIQAILSTAASGADKLNFCWLSDDECTARLVYVDGKFCPALSNEQPGMVRNIQACNFSLEKESHLVQPILHLPDGFTDEIPTTEEKIANGSKARLLSTLSGPNHAVGKPWSQFAINGQQGTAAFCAVNTLKCTSIALVEAPQNHVADKPILILNLYTSTTSEENTGIAYHPRVLVMAGRNSCCNVIQAVADFPTRSKTAVTAAPRMHNGYTQFFIQENANVTHTYVDESGGLVGSNLEQDDAIDTTRRDAEKARPESRNLHMECINVQHTAKSATYKGTILSVGGNGRSRTCVANALAHQGCHAAIQGLMLSAGLQRNDMRTTIHHIGQGTTADQLQKNLVGGRATATFKGRIRVEQPAQQTNANQLVRTILTSDKCRIWAMPSLEIIADDVKCTHGATVSDLSEEEMFYLNSRGLDTDAARKLLMYGYINEILEGAENLPKPIIGDESFGLRSRLMDRLYNMIPKGKRAVMGEFQSI